MTLCCTLSACGGGGSSAPAPKPAVPVQISAAGDSTMAGLVKNADGTYTVTNDLQTDLQTQFGPTVTVVNNARSGATLANMLGGTGFTQTLAKHLAADTSRVIIENFAINDNVQTPADTFQTELIQFGTMVRAAGKIPVLEEPNPLCDPTQPPSENVESVYDGRTVSTFVDIIDVRRGGGKHASGEAIQPGQGASELVLHDVGRVGHPSPALYAIKAQNEAVVLAPIVRQLDD